MEKRSIALSTMRRVVGQRMCESLERTAQYTLSREIEVDALLDHLQGLREAGSGLKLTHLLVKIAATLLRRHEKLNASIEEGQLVLHDYVNMGVAVALEDGLLVPVIMGADSASPEEIAAVYEELVPKARRGRLRQANMMGGTFTISNLGMEGIDAFTPIVNYPESAILGVGRVREGLSMDADGALRRKRSMIFSLSLDHRIIDGVTGARFLTELSDTLSDSEKLRAALEWRAEQNKDGDMK